MTDEEALKIMQDFCEEEVQEYYDPMWSPEQVEALGIVLDLAARYIDLE